MKRINVIDLDSTLIPYDSFNRLIRKRLKDFDLVLGFYLSLRILRLLSSERFKALVSKHWSKYVSQNYFEVFAKEVEKDINLDVLNLIMDKTDTDTINILLSASPHIYVKHLISLLDWEGSGSYFDDQKFINLYGSQKVEWLLKHFPQKDYIYNFSISDSHSDDALLALFQESQLWEG